MPKTAADKIRAGKNKRYRWVDRESRANPFDLPKAAPANRHRAATAGYDADTIREALALFAAVTVLPYVRPKNAGWQRLSHAEARYRYTTAPADRMRPVRWFPGEPGQRRKDRTHQRWRNVLNDSFDAVHKGLP